jgi:hypothetical protein
MRRLSLLFCFLVVFGFLPQIAGCGKSPSDAGQPTVVTPPNDPNLPKIRTIKRSAQETETVPSKP